MALVWTLAAPAFAQSTPTDPVTIAIAACGDAREEVAHLAQQVELELRVAGITVVDAVSAPDDATHVTIVPAGCIPTEGAAIVVRAPGRAPLRRPLEIDGDGADRVLALALVDAVRQAWAQPREDRARAATQQDLEAVRASGERGRAAVLREVTQRTDALRAAIAEERAAREREAIARAALPAWDLFGGGVILGYEGGAALVGGTVGGGLTLIGPLRLAIGASGGYGLVSDPLGEVGLGAVRGVLALELHVRAAPLEGFAGLWASAGWSRAEGRPASPTTAGASLEAATGAIGLRAGGMVEVDANWSLFARVDAGYGFGGVAANAGMRRITGTRGALLSLTIGARFRP